MATLTISHASLANVRAADAEPKAAPSPVRKGFFARFLQAMQESRMRQAQIEIRRVKAMIGDKKSPMDDALLPFRGE
jgi:hypothetical protein